MRLLLHHHGFHAVFLAPDPTHGHPSHEERVLVRHVDSQGTGLPNPERHIAGETPAHTREVPDCALAYERALAERDNA